VERENAFFKSSPVDENHLPPMNSEKVCFWVYGIQNFGFLAFIGTELVSRQISATATARDRRNFFIAQIMLFIHKKSTAIPLKLLLEFICGRQNSSATDYFHPREIISKKHFSGVLY
jgi:hypothetical protein